jgi:DNA polymerase I
MKGIETVRRDWCDLVSETLYKTLEIILKDQNPKAATNYIKDVLSKLERNEIEIEKLVITKSISKPLRHYKGIQPHIELVKKMRKRDPTSTPGIGDRVGFVIIKGLQLMSDRAESPEYVKQNNLKIDSKYYIESQIIPPLERVFEAMGIDKTELISTGKQILLTDIIKRDATKTKGREDFVLSDIDGFICDRCNKTFRRIPLVGKCVTCGGEIMFYSGDIKARYYNT